MKIAKADFTREEINLISKVGDIACVSVSCQACSAYNETHKVCLICLCKAKELKWRQEHGQHNNDQT